MVILGSVKTCGPFGEGEIGRHDQRGPLVEPADQMEEELPTRLGERQVAELVLAARVRGLRTDVHRRGDNYSRAVAAARR